MKDFSILMFNPQPEPPADGLLQTTGQGGTPETYYEYKLKNVMVSSYQTSG